MNRSNYKLSRLECLPPEIITMILSELDCIDTLMDAIRASPRLWHVYKESNKESRTRSRIATRVLFNQLDAYDVRKAALSTLWVFNICQEPRSKDSITEFFESEFNSRSAEDVYGSKMQTIEIGYVNQLHCTISRFADMFIRDGKTKLRRLTVSERGRIIRALYYLEMYFIFARKHWMLREIDGEEDPDALFEGEDTEFPHMDCLLVNFAPWENEQMACLWQFLAELATEAYEEIEERWPSNARGWNCSLVEPGYWFDTEQPPSIPFLGLRNMEYIMGVGDHDLWDRQLRWVDREPTPFPRLIRTLYGDLGSRWQPPRVIPEPGIYGKHSKALVDTIKDPQYWHSQVKPLFYSEPDDGPFSMWKQAYAGYTTQSAVYRLDNLHIAMRMGGFYFWDKADIEAVRDAHVEAGDTSIPALISKLFKKIRI